MDERYMNFFSLVLFGLCLSGVTGSTISDKELEALRVLDPSAEEIDGNKEVTDGVTLDTDGDTEGTEGIKGETAATDNSGTDGDTAGTDGDTDGTVGDSDGTDRDTDGTAGDTDGTDRDTDGTAGDTDGTVGDTDGTVGDIDGTDGDTDGTIGDIDGTDGDTDGTAGDTDEIAGDTDGTVGDIKGSDGQTEGMNGDTEVAEEEAEDIDEKTGWPENDPKYTVALPNETTENERQVYEEFETVVRTLKEKNPGQGSDIDGLSFHSRRQNSATAPVGLWPLNSQYGASDVTGNGNNGVATGTQLVQGPYGNADGAFLFSGTANSYVDIPNNGRLDVQSAYTILAHIFHTGRAGPIFNYVGNHNAWAVHLWQQTPSQLFMRTIGRSGRWSPAVYANVLQQNAWNYVGGTYDSGTRVETIWNNGELVGQRQTSLESVATQYPVRVAKRDGDSRIFAGRIACLQLYDYAMTKEQIVAARDTCRNSSGTTSMMTTALQTTEPTTTLGTRQAPAHLGELSASTTCTNDYMELSIPEDQLTDINLGNLHWEPDQNCGASTNGTHYIFRTELYRCGTQVTFGPKYVTFLNTINILGIHLSGGVITREGDISITSKCKYERQEWVDSTFLPIPGGLNFTEEGFGQLEVRLSMFPTRQYQSSYRAGQYPIHLKLRQYMYMQLEVHGHGQNLSVLALNCRATMSPNPNDTLQYPLIRDGCGSDPTLQTYSINDNSKERFGFEAFRFIREVKTVYVHCEVMVCNGADSGSRCAQGCVRRGKRGAEEKVDMKGRHMIYQGPIILDDDKEDALRLMSDQETASGRHSAPWAMLAAGGGLMALALVVMGAAIVLKRSRREEWAYQSLPNMAEDGE